ncbi:hypothetical protein GCM10017691_08060 [Pseudonocardia petroleophila]|uniref:Uncharacterized protein n=1 Tax=Pseudonocardia petroleophila TaxID=37331 RepID=A0A7G7MJM9_9PSEU|nr:hypothetical protein [Pseudonocardia petroleophila]QNG52990.1 hypothetical protein H6H00_02795 [Pseudonocardia petroleophila]
MTIFTCAPDTDAPASHLVRRRERRYAFGLATAALAVAVTGASVGPALSVDGGTPSGLAATTSLVDGPTMRIVDSPAPQASPAVNLVAVHTLAAAPAARASWWHPWGDYGRCVLGIGVPVGVAWYFVTTLGTRTALAALRRQPLPPWAGAGAKRYADAVWNSCARFIAS